MKKKHVALLLVCSIFCGGLLVLKNIWQANKSTKQDLINWNNTVFESAKKNIHKDIICYDGGELFLLNANEDDFQTSLENKIEIALHHTDYPSFDTDLYPFKAYECTFLFQSHNFKIVSKDSVLEHKFLETEKICAITYPLKDANRMYFFVIKKDTSKQAYYLEKLIYENGSIKREKYTQIFIPNDLFIRRYSEISFFIIRNNIINLILAKDNKQSFIYQFSMNGLLLKKGMCAEFFIPNIYDDALYYVIKAEIKKEHCMCSKFSLMKDDKEIALINYPMNQGCFFSKDLVSFIFYDSDEYERFDFTNGPWPPIPVSYIYNVIDHTLKPMYFKNPWKVGNFFTKSNIKNNAILIIY